MREMFNGYKDAPSYYNNQSLFENRNQGPFLPADTSKQTSAPPWDYTQQSFNTVPCYTGDQNLNHRHSDVIHNQVVSQFDNNNILAHYKNISSGNNHQSVVRPRAVINCQSNCNACYNHSVGRIPSHWNPPTENVHYVPGSSAATVPTDNVTRFAPNLASFPQHEDSSHHITSGFATQLNKLSRFSKETVPTSAPKKDVLSPKEDCSVLRNHLPRAEPPPNDSATVKKDTCVACRGVCNRTTCKFYQHQSIKFPSLEPIALQQYGVPRENVVRYTGQSSGNSNCNQWPPVGTHQPPGLWLQNSRPPGFWMPPTENIRNVGNTNITNFWGESGCDTSNQQLPPPTSYHEVNTDKPAGPIRNHSQKEADEYQEPPRYTELLVRRKMPDEMPYQPHGTLADCGIPQDMQYRPQVDIQSNKDIPPDSSSVSETTRSHASLKGVNSVLPNFPPDLSNQSRYHKPKLPPSSSSSNFSPVLGIAQPPSRFSSDPTYTQSKISRSNNYMRLFPEHTIEDTYNLSSDIVGNSFSSFSRSGTTNRHLPYHSVKHPSNSRNAESIIRFEGESSANVNSTHLQPCGRMPSDSAQYQGISSMQVVESNPSCSMSVSTYINSPPNRRETGYQNMMSSGGDCNMYYNRQTLHPLSYDDDNYNIHTKIGVISRSSKETCHLTPPSVYMSVDKPQLLPLLDESGVNRPIKKRKPRTKMRSEQERWQSDRNSHEMSAPVLDVRQFLATWDEETDDLSPAGQKLPDVVLSNSSVENPLLVLDCRTINTNGVATLSTVDRNSLSDGNGPENVIHMYQHEISPSSCNSSNNDIIKSDVDPVVTEDLPARPPRECPSLIPIEPDNVDTCIKPLPAMNLLESYQVQENLNSCSIEEDSIKSPYKSPDNSEISRNSSDPPLQKCQNPHENDKDSTPSKVEISKLQECQNLPDNLHLETSPCPKDSDNSDPNAGGKANDYLSSEMCSTDKSNLNNTVRELPLLIKDDTISVPTLRSLCTTMLKQNGHICNEVEKPVTLLPSSECMNVLVKPKFDSDTTLNAKNVSENSFEISHHHFKVLDLSEENENNSDFPISNNERNALEAIENNKIIPLAYDKSLENESFRLNEEMKEVHKKHDFNICDQISPKAVENTTLNSEFVTLPDSPSVKDCVQELIKNIDEISKNESVKIDDNLNHSELTTMSDSFEIQGNENINSNTSKEESFYLKNVGDIGEDLDMSVTSSIPSTPGSDFQESEDEMLNMQLKVSDSDSESPVDIPVNPQHSDCNELTLSPEAVMLKESVDVTADPYSKHFSDDFDKLSNSGDIFANLVEENTDCNDKSVLHNCPLNTSVGKTDFENCHETNVNSLGTLPSCSSGIHNTISTDVNENEAQVPDQITSNAVSKNCDKIGKRKQLNVTDITELDKINLFENLEDIPQYKEKICVQLDSVSQHSSMTVHKAACKEDTNVHPNSDLELPNTTEHIAECQLDSGSELPSKTMHITEDKENSFDQLASKFFSRSEIDISENINKITDGTPSVVKDTSSAEKNEVIESNNCDNISSDKLLNSTHSKSQFEASRNRIISAEIMPSLESDQQENAFKFSNVKSIPDHEIHNLEDSKDKIIEAFKSTSLKYDGDEETKICEGIAAVSDNKEEFEEERFLCTNPETASENENVDALDLVMRTSACCNDCESEESETKDIPLEVSKNTKIQNLGDTKKLDRKEASHSTPNTSSYNKKEKIFIKNAKTNNDSDINIIKANVENLDIRVLKQAQTKNSHANRKAEKFGKNEVYEVKVDELCDKNNIHDCEMPSVLHDTSSHMESNLTDHNKSSMESVESIGESNEERNDSLVKENNQNEERSVLQEIIGTCLTPLNTDSVANNSLENLNVSKQVELCGSVRDDHQEETDNGEEYCDIGGRVTKFTDDSAMSVEKVIKEKELQCKAVARSSLQKAPKTYSAVQNMTCKSSSDDTSFPLDDILENTEYLHCSQPLHLCSNEDMSCGFSDNSSFKQIHSEDEFDAQGSLEISKENKTLAMSEADIDAKAESNLVRNEIDQIGCLKIAESLVTDSSCRYETDKTSQNSQSGLRSTNIVEDAKFTETFSNTIESVPCTANSSLMIKTDGSLESEFQAFKQECSKEEKRIETILVPAQSVISRKAPLITTDESNEAESNILGQKVLKDNESNGKTSGYVEKKMKTNCSVVQREGDEDVNSVRLCPEGNISEGKESGGKLEKEETDEFRKEVTSFYYDSVTVPSRIFEIDEELDYDYDDCDEEEEEEEEEEGDGEEEEEEMKMQAQEEEEKKQEESEPQQKKDEILQERHESFYKNVNSYQLEADKLSETLRGKELERREVVSDERESVIYCGTGIGKQKECISIEENSNIKSLNLDLGYACLGGIEKENNENEVEDEDERAKQESRQRTQEFVRVIDSFQSEVANVSSGIVGENGRERVREKAEEEEYKSVTEDSKISKSIQPEATEMSSEVKVNNNDEVEEKQEPLKDLNVIESCTETVNPSSVASAEERKDSDKLEGSRCLYTEMTDATSDSLKDISEETKGKREEEVEKENICDISFRNPVQSEVVDISSGVSQEQEKNDDECNGETGMEKEEDEEKAHEDIERIQIYLEDNTIVESQVIDLSTLPLFPENRMEVSEEDTGTTEETLESMKSFNSINSYCNESMTIKSSDDLLCSDIMSEVKSRNFESTESSCLPKNKNALNKSESNSITALQDFGKETNDLSKSFSLPLNEVETHRESAKTLEDDPCKFVATEILKDCVLPNDNIRDVTKNNLVPVLVNSLLQNDHVSHYSENSSCSSANNSTCDVIIDFDKNKDGSYKQKSKEYQGDNELDNQRSAQICKIDDKNKSEQVSMEEETVKDNVTIKMDEIGETQNKDTIKSKGLKAHDDDSSADSLSLIDEDVLEYQDISSANNKKIKNNYPKKSSKSMQNIEHDLNYNLLQDEKINHNRKLTESIVSQNVSNNEEKILCNPTEKDFLQQDVNQLAEKYDTEKTNLNISLLEKQDFSCDEIDRGSFHFEDVDNDCSNISFEKLSPKDNEKHCGVDANVTVEDEASTPAATSECDLQFEENDIEVKNSEGNISVSNSSETHFFIKSNGNNEHEKCLENVDCHSSEEEYETVKGTGAVESDIRKSYLLCKSESSKIQTSIDMDDMPHLEIINTEISPDDSDSLEMPCLELFTDTIKVTENGPELSPEIASPTSTKETREEGNSDIKKDNANTNLIIMAKAALMNTVKNPDPLLSHKEKNSCTKIILKPEIPDKLSPVENVPLSKCPNKNCEQYNSEGVLLQHDSSVLLEIEKEQLSLSNNKEMLAEDVQNDSVSLSNNKEILTEDLQNDSISLPNNKKILAEDLQDDMELSHIKEKKIKANLQNLPLSPNTLRVLSSYLESDTTTLQVVEVSADELQEEWESLQLATSDLVNVTAIDDKTQDLNVLMSTVENSDTPVSAENVAFQTKLANSQDKTPVCLSESDNSISKESEKLDLLTSEVVSFQSLAITYRVSNSNLDDIIPTESVSNWPYLEEEVFSDLPVTNTNSVDILCAASSIVSPQPCVSEESSPSPGSSNDITTNSSQINSTQCESSLAINELKCRLSWKRIFNLSKANRRKQHQTNSVHIDASNDKAHIDSRNSELFSSDLETSDDTVLNEDTSNKSEILKGIVKNKQKIHGLRKKQIELGLAKIEVRLTPTPPLKGVGLQKKWEVVDGPKFEKIQKSFTDSISIDSMDPSSGTTNPVPIVLVKKLILKRRSSDESEGDSEVKRPNISSNLELSSKSNDIPNNPDNLDNIQSAIEIGSLDEDMSNDSKSQINTNRSSECEEDASSITSAVSTASGRSSSRSESQSSSSTMENSRSRTSSRMQNTSRSDSGTRSITRSRSRSRTRSNSREKNRTRSNSREKSRTRSNSREKSRTRSNSREKSRTRSNSREKSRTRSNSREKSRTRSNSREKSRTRSNSREKNRIRSNSREKNRTMSNSREKSRTRSNSREKSRTRSNSREKSRTRSNSREKNRTRSNSREKSRIRSNSREKSRTRSNNREKSRTRSNSREKSRTRSNSREKSRTRSNSREKSRTRSNSREKSRTRSNSREKSRTRSNSREKSRTRSNSREKSRTRSNSREKSRTRSNSREKSRTRSNSREKSRTRSNSREKSRTRSNSREKSRTRSNSREKNRTRSNSREKNRTRSNSREKNRTRSNTREKSRTRSNSREKSRTRHNSRTRSRTRSTSKNSMSSGGENNSRERSELTISKTRSRTRSSSGSSSRTRSGRSSRYRTRNRTRSNSGSSSRNRRSRSNTVENKIRNNSRIRNRTTRSRSRSTVTVRSGNRMESRSRSNSSTRNIVRSTNKMGSRSRTRSSNRVGNRGRTKSSSGTEERTRSNSRIGIRNRSNNETASRSNSFDSTKSRLSETDLCKTQSESNEQNNINSHPEPAKISVDEVTDKFRCECFQLCICPKVVDEINLSEDRLLPKVIIKRTSGMGNTNNYRSFLRSASLSNTDSQWQPVVRLERSSSLDELAKQISTRNGSYKDELSHGLKITLKSPTCQPCVQLVPLPFNRIRRHSESESEASKKQRRRKYFSRINAHRSAVNRWRTRRCNKLVLTSDSVSILSDTNDTEPNSEPSLSIKLTTFNSFTKVQNETRQTDKNKSHIITNLKNSEDDTHKVLENDENDEYRVVENKNYTKENATKITFQRHKKKEKVLRRNKPKVINVKIKEYKLDSVQNQSSQQGAHEDEATRRVASSTKENSMKITFQLHKKKETLPKMIDLKMKDYRLDLAHNESNQETIQEDETIQKVTSCKNGIATESNFQQNKKKEEVLNGNEPRIINLKIEECKQDNVQNKSKQQITQEDETQQVAGLNKENSTKIMLQDHKKKEDVLNGNKSKISIKIKENKQVLMHNDSNQQSVHKNETTEKVASSSSETNNKRLSSELDHGKVDELHLKKKQHLAGIDGNEVPQPSPERVTIDIPTAELHVTSDISDHSGIKKKRNIDDIYQKSDELPFFQPDRILSISSIKKKRTCIDKINPELDSPMPKDKCESLNEIEISKKINVCDEISTTTVEEMGNKDQPSESHAVSVPHDRVCQACGHIYENQNERALHVRQHPYHCQRCHLAFQSECDFVGHLSEQHPRTRERHHCLLCERTFPTADRHRLHLASRTHRHLELTQRRTIHTLYSIFTGQNCPVLPPLTETELAGLNWFPVEPGTIHFYHQATPLQRAVQDLITKKKGDCVNAAPVTSRRSAEDNSSTS